MTRLARTEALLSGLLAVTDGNTGLSDLRRGGTGLALRGILSPYAAVIGIEDTASPIGGRAYLLGRFRPLLLVDGLRVALLPLLFFPASVRHPAHRPWEPPSVSGRQRKACLRFHVESRLFVCHKWSLTRWLSEY